MIKKMQWKIKREKDRQKIKRKYRENTRKSAPEKFRETMILKLKTGFHKKMNKTNQKLASNQEGYVCREVKTNRCRKQSRLRKMIEEV